MSARILTVTLNPAIDVTYRVPRLEIGETVRVPGVRIRAGGKGVNVAAVARSLGSDSLVLGLTQILEPDEFRAGLDRLGLPHRLVPALDSVRRTVAVVEDDGTTTSLQEHGPAAAAGAEIGIQRVLRTELVTGAGAVVVSGSVPPGLDADVPARLVALATAVGVPVIADVSGPALRAVATAGAVLMPNRDELGELLGAPVRSPGDVVAAGRHLVRDGAAALVATLGEEGAVAVTPGGDWSVRPFTRVTGNPTGAGDAAAAALARHLAAAGEVSGVDWPTALADVVATAAAAVLRPVAGEVDLEARATWLVALTTKESV
ncbi:1-phosphofructokinase family hexose kinase [Amycolatopsis sp. WQ 127309]|uniref:1-phosphofructokinase family hexose kinase n=1 Tax=Amycolatopsis sp. WQ 127309 TaxID=2932773 RepID=UPI001FF12B19|nr:hexose kinase [Amycolatopsis sp. WQ 127309]UOZ05560.1 hexose kinase [Amycolatopsis sp. WQ 127309]